MIQLKTNEEIRFMKVAAKHLSYWMNGIIEKIFYFDFPWTGKLIEQEFLEYLNGLTPSLNFKAPFCEVKNKNGNIFGSPICISINDEIVHCRPDNRLFRSGDMIKIDAGLSYRGYCADMARTIIFPNPSDFKPTDLWFEKTNFRNITIDALNDGIAACIVGNTIGDISKAINKVGQDNKLGIVTDYAGHGIGLNVHESPIVPNMPGIHIDEQIVLRANMILCIEPMFTMGSGLVLKDSDGWRVWTADGAMACHEESEILITEFGPEVLTK